MWTKSALFIVCYISLWSLAGCSGGSQQETEPLDSDEETGESDRAGDASVDATDSDEESDSVLSTEVETDQDTEAQESDSENSDTDSGSEICEDGQTRDLPCGRNGRGLIKQTCEKGVWVSLQCVDPDVCTDDDSREETCGVMGTRTDTCVEGHWQTGLCVDKYEGGTGEIPAESRGNSLYFSAKQVDDKYNSDLYRLRMAGDQPELEQLTETAQLDEVSPAIPLNRKFMVYANGYYSDVAFSRLRWVSLDGDGLPEWQTDKEILGRNKETCDMTGQDSYYGNGNPAVSLDGEEIVFVSSYKADEDEFGCPVVANRLSRASLDAAGNLGAIRPVAWDEGPTPGPAAYKPLSPVYLYDTKRIAVSIFGLDQHPLSTEIAICNEECSSLGDWDYLTYAAIWSSINVAQRCLASDPTTDSIGFYRLAASGDFRSGVYVARGISDASPHPVYGSYGVLDTDENFVTALGADNLRASHKNLAFSPDGQLLAVAVTFVLNEIRDERTSELAILDVVSGEILWKTTFDSGLREVDGLVWR